MADNLRLKTIYIRLLHARLTLATLTYATTSDGTGETMTADPIQILPAGYAPALNTAQASAYLGLAEKTLEGFRYRGGGPRFVKYGRKAVRYLKPDLDAFMAARTVGSTSEAA